MVLVMAGERRALSLLVERYYGAILGYLYRLVGGQRPLAEDLAQETFIRLLGDAHYQPARPFKPWLYAIATNRARDYLKSAGVRHAAPPDDGSAARCDTAPGPEESVLEAEEAQAVATALDQLGEEYRVTLVLRFYNGLSLQEIADTLDLPLGTVKSRLSVGTRRLATLLRARQPATRDARGARR
jgi:RNA polymerase sigma-70 factor (ECF subfamily)